MVEYFDVVDPEDKVIGKASREECHSGKMLLHRAIIILITNSSGEFLFQKRSMKKDMDSGRWAIGVAGHLDAGEGYEQAAKREAMEEVGIGCKPTLAFKMLAQMKTEREMVSIYTCRHDGPFRINEEEADELKFMDKAKVMEMLKSGKMTEFDTQIMKRFFGVRA
jgi:isopentenyldiphosphate isomerase